MNSTMRLNYYTITHLKLIKKVREFYSKQRNKIINDYEEKVDEKNDTRRKFLNHLERQLSKVESVIYTILSHIDNNEQFNKLKFKLYSNEAYKFINERIAKAFFEDDYSFQRFLRAKFPYLSKEEYRKRMGATKQVRNDKEYINSMDDFLT